MKMIKTILKCMYDGAVNTVYHDGIEHAGYIAFLSLLSLFPFLVFFFAIVGFFGQSDIGLKLFDIITHNDLIPENVITALEPRIEEIVSGPPQGLLTLSILGAIWTASSAVEGLRTTLNRAYRVGTPPAYVLRRLLSIGQFLILTGIIIAVIFLLIIAPNIWAKIQQFIAPSFWDKVEVLFDDGNKHKSYNNQAWDYFRYAATSLILFFSVALSFITIPNIRQSWKSVAPGALLVVILWFISGSLLSSYLSNFDQVNVIYGSLGGLIAALLFFYFCAMIFIYGAEFNYLLEKSLGHKIEQKEEVEISDNIQ